MSCGHARDVTAGRRVDHELEARTRRLERPHRPQQQLDDRRVDERAVAEVDEQVSPGARHAERVVDRVEARDIVVAAERDDGRGGRDDLDRHGAGRRAAAVEEIPCVIRAFRLVPLPGRWHHDDLSRAESIVAALFIIPRSALKDARS